MSSHTHSQLFFPMKHTLVAVFAIAALVTAGEEWKLTQDESSKHQIHEDCIKVSGLTGEQYTQILSNETTVEEKVREYDSCKVNLSPADSNYRVMARYLSRMMVRFKDDGEKVTQGTVARSAKEVEQTTTPEE